MILYLFRQRAAAETLPEEHKGYVFDLDSREGDDDDNMEDKYSVDSYDRGKWSFDQMQDLPNRILHRQLDTLCQVSFHIYRHAYI